MEEKQPEKTILQQQTPPVMENTPPQQPVQTPQKKGFFPKWGIYVVIAVFALGVSGVGVGAYYYLTKEDKEGAAPEVSTSDTTDKTNNDQESNGTDTEKDPYEGWKTYTSEKYRFSFKHPNLDSTCCSLAGSASGNPQKYIVLADKSTVIPNTGKAFDGIAVYFEYNVNNLSFEEYLEAEKEELIENYKTIASDVPTNTTETTRTVGGLEATVLKGYLASIDTGSSLDNQLIYVPYQYSNDILIISTSEESEGHFKDLENIIKSFTITETEETFEDWKSYTSPTVGYSLRYPKDYSINASADIGDKCLTVQKGSVRITIASTDTEYCLRSDLADHDPEVEKKYTINEKEYTFKEYLETIENNDGSFGNVYGFITENLGEETEFMLEYNGYPKEEFEVERDTIEGIIESIEW